MRKAKLILLLALALTLCACRARVLAQEPQTAQTAEPPAQETAVPVRIDAVAEQPRTEEPQTEEPPREQAAEPDAPAEPDEDSERRAYADNASGELTPDAETPLYAETDQPADAAGGEAGGAGNAETAEAALTATETLPSDEAERLGADESGEVAESVQTYYLTLLDSRLGSLFECKRFYVYWETDEDHRTVFKTSDEHQIILGAGAYDVSAKLLAENLTVDDGWVTRKNPDAVVKVVPGGALDPAAARALCGELSARPDWAGIGAVREGRLLILSGRLLETQAGRTAAAVYLAKLLYPAQMEDVDADEALRALTQEAFGSAYGGQYAYTM